MTVVYVIYSFFFIFLGDVVQLTFSFEEFFSALEVTTGLNPRAIGSISMLSKHTAMKKGQVILCSPQSVPLSKSIERGIRGGYSDAVRRVVFDTRLFKDQDGKEKKVFFHVHPLSKEDETVTDLKQKHQKSRP